MSEWQPIETAPRDGTPIFAYIPEVFAKQKGRKSRVRKRQARMCAVRWFSEIVPPKGWIISDHAKELLEKHGGLWSGHRLGLTPTVGQPTHWMPLPEPPK